MLEASILRNPEPLHRADDDDVVEEEDGKGDGDKEKEEESHFNTDLDPDLGAGTGPGLLDRDAPDGNIASLPPRDAARRRWLAFLRDWFVGGGAGDDDGFDYAAVDDDSDYDALARADAEEAWFDQQSPGWVSEGGGEGGTGGHGGEGAGLEGETGIQDF